MAKRKPKSQTPRKTYKAATAINTTTEHGRAELWHQRIDRARDELHIDDRRETAAETWRFLNGTYAAGGNERLYLNEAYPAFKELILGTVPGLPDTVIEARQGLQDELARRCEALVDATLDSGLCRAYDAIIDAEWDESGWGLGILRISWRREERQTVHADTDSAEYIAPHGMRAEEENRSPFAARIAENDDDQIHAESHLAAMRRYQAMGLGPDEMASLADHIQQHLDRMLSQPWAYPVIERVDPRRFVYDPDAESWEDRAWEAELCEDYVADLEGIPGIKHLDKANCPPTDEFDAVDADEAQKDDAFDFALTKVQVWKCHDRRTGEYLYVPAKWGDSTKPILEIEWPYGPCDIYHTIVHEPIPGRVHGMALRSLVAAILEELARTNAAIRKHVRRCAAYKKITAKGNLTRQDIADIQNEDLPVAQVNEEALAAGAMQDYKPPEVPISVLNYRQTLLDELRRLIGNDIMHQGGDTPHRITASEAQLRGSYQSQRMDRRQEEVSKFLNFAARNILLYYRLFGGDQLPVRVAGPAGYVVQLLDPRTIPDDLVVKFDVKQNTEGQQAKDLQAATQFVTAVTSMLVPGQFDPVQLVIWLGRKLGVRNPESVLAAQGEMTPMGVPGAMPAQQMPNETPQVAGQVQQQPQQIAG